MNREDIIRMALEAGFDAHDMSDDFTCNLRDIERFAALVVAAERERIIAANAPEIDKINAHFKTLEDALAAEREACAKVCDEMAARDKLSNYFAVAAKAIRARGNT